MSSVDSDLTQAELQQLGTLTEGCTCCDLQQVCREAAMGPVRAALQTCGPGGDSSSLIVNSSELNNMAVKPVSMKHFLVALSKLGLEQPVLHEAMSEE